jgi:hypothetical protein
MIPLARLWHSILIACLRKSTAMKIRTISAFVPLRTVHDSEQELRAAVMFLSKAKSAFEAAGYEVQTLRILTNSFEVRH